MHIYYLIELVISVIFVLFFGTSAQLEIIITCEIRTSNVNK